MADTIFDNTLAGTLRLLPITQPGVLTYQNSGTDNSFSIGVGDLNDYYKFTVARSSDLTVKLNPQGGNLSLQVLDAGGNPLTGELTNNPNSLADSFNLATTALLQPGQDYYIRVFAASATTEINYALTIETSSATQADIYWQNLVNPGLNAIWRMNGTQITDVQGSPDLITLPWLIQAIADFNGDGTDDILWQNTSDGMVAFWLMDQTGLQIRSVTVSPIIAPGNWYVGGVGNFGGDASLDIIWRDIQTGLTGIWVMDDTNFVSVLEIDSIADPSWFLQQVTDFNLDGKSDLFFRNLTTGQNTIWLMDGTTFSAAQNIDPRPVTWVLDATGDFDGDGDQDLLWHDRGAGGTNSLEVWFLNQTNYVSSVVVSNVPGNLYFAAGVIDNALPLDLAGNFSTSSFNVGVLDGTAEYRDLVNFSDSQDFYGFNLEFSTKIKVTGAGTNLAANVNIDILAADGVTVIASTTVTDANTKQLSDLLLDPGNYFVRITSVGTGDTSYSLKLEGEKQLASNLLFPTTPPPTIVYKRTDGTTFTSTSPISVQNPFVFDLTYDMTYVGGALNQFEVGFYLSKNNTLETTGTAPDLRLDLLNPDGSDVPGGSDVAIITGTTPNTVITRTQRLRLPSKDSPFWIDDGLYNIIIVLDPENKILERDPVTNNLAETDNNFATPITVRDARLPDLTLQNPTVSNTSPTKGQTITVNASVANIGTAASDTGRPGTNFEVRFYLSRDNVFNLTATDPGDRDIRLTTAPTTVQFPSLAAGQSVSITNLQTLIPQTWAGYRAQGASTSYFVLMVVDPGGSVNELGEFNPNTGAQTPVVGPNDVAPIAVTIPFA